MSGGGFNVGMTSYMHLNDDDIEGSNYIKYVHHGCRCLPSHRQPPTATRPTRSFFATSDEHAARVTRGESNLGGNTGPWKVGEGVHSASCLDPKLPRPPGASSIPSPPTNALCPPPPNPTQDLQL